MEEVEIKEDGRIKRFGKNLLHGAVTMLPLVILVGAYALFDNGAKAGINRLATGSWVPIGDGDVNIEITETPDIATTE